ncbi:MAG: NusG domain II-containing protein [Clostridia bacterium]|nr:NusG domain II-containing protein [Clostridia bacterium]
MALKKIEQVKQDKGFKIFDLIIYGVIAVTVAVLFIVIFTTRNTDPLTGLRVYVKAELVFEYEFGMTESAEDGKRSERITVEEDGDNIKIIIEEGNDRNTIQIDKKAKSVKMVEANCNGRDCMLMKMKNNSDQIICNSHRVRIEPYINDLGNPNITI